MKYFIFVKTKFLVFFLLCFFLILNSNMVIAGPPYDTDDPVPVDFKSWELSLSSISSYYQTFSQGTLPHFEANYGIIKNAMLHMIVPLAFDNEYGVQNNFGLGDIEVGIKYRFIEETKYRPQIGIFPLCEIPTGNPENGLGSGKAQFFLPVWIQKSFGDKWQTYGGYGYWINPGEGNKNWNYVGWQVQYQVDEKVSVGAEVYYTTADTEGGENATSFNIGSVIDINEHNHILLSAGRSFNNNTLFQCYVGYLFTISSKPTNMRNHNFKLKKKNV